MLGVPDEDLDIAEQKLIDAGFIRQGWSFCSTIDPELFKGHPGRQKVHASLLTAYESFDSKARIFNYPDKSRRVLQTILLPTSYLRLNIFDPYQAGYEDPTPSLSQPPLYNRDNLYWPNVVMLLQSLIMIIEEEQSAPRMDFVQSLRGWAFAYLVNELSLRHDILDSCRYASVKALFNKRVNRGQPRPIREKWNKPRKLITNSLI
jgi:hypothetical protein